MNNTAIKQLCVVLSLCIAYVGVAQPSENKRSESASDKLSHDNSVSLSATSLLALPAFPSVEAKYSLASLEPAKEASLHQDNKPRFVQVVYVESHNQELQDLLRKTSPHGVIIRTEEPISSFIRPQNPESTRIKRSILPRLLCCCCK